jgi:hypothetical protein
MLKGGGRKGVRKRRYEIEIKAGKRETYIIESER